MLYLIIGNGGEVSKEIKKISPNIELQRFDTFSWDPDLVRSSIESSSLFGGGENAGLLFESMKENEEAWNLLLAFKDHMVQSSKIFVILESDLTDDVIEIFEKKAKVVDKRESKPAWGKKFENEKFNPFALGDAVGRGLAKGAWIEYERARLLGAEAEELHARIWSKVRDMISSSNSSAEALGIHPFVYKKAKADLNNWKKEKLDKLKDDLLSVYHDSRMGGLELDLALEKLLLSI